MERSIKKGTIRETGTEWNKISIREIMLDTSRDGRVDFIRETMLETSTECRKSFIMDIMLDTGTEWRIVSIDR